MLVGPILETHVPVIYDTDTRGFGGPNNMDGPQIGMLAYSEPAGNLHLTININYAIPSTQYQVFLVGGPAHSSATGFVNIGTLITNAVGAGNGTFTVAHATLLAPPFGAGYRTDHIDLLHAVGDLKDGVLAAGAINYFVCREKDQPGHPGLKVAEASKAAVGHGDPLGSKGAESDPLTGKKG